MTKLRRRASRTDVPASKDGKVGRIDHVPALDAKPTLSVATVRTDDVPVLVREPPQAKEEVGLLALVSAIDGTKDISVLAKACHLEVEQVRAFIASLMSKGFVTLTRAKAPSLPGDHEPQSEKPKGEDYWLKGLKPRTR